ncbi:carbon-nitrogen hydrolase family protein [Candidatus Bathyarchaeota archaeon]|nr:carbon-nitrogen hydrolase family protein [Candidatus Bathyarchaeota archaeon]
MGRNTRVATVCQGGNFHNTVEANREYIMKLLDLALKQKPDIVCLPETFTAASITKPIEELAETVPGPTSGAVAQRAKKHSCYIICPIFTLREGKIWNSAIIIDRNGEVAGIYDKVHPVTSSSDYAVFEKGVTPGAEVPVFDLDFGRIGIQICFDINFPESWRKLSENGVKMVFWPSAYNGGFPLQVYAYLHHYYVVSSVCTEKSRIVDPCGVILAETDKNMSIVYRDVNLDYVVSHYDFNYSIPDKIMATYPSRVKIRSHIDEGQFLVEPADETLTTEQLQKEFGFESAFEYFQRHAKAYNRIFQDKRPVPQKAAHGERPMYEKN